MVLSFESALEKFGAFESVERVRGNAKNERNGDEEQSVGAQYSHVRLR
jgi:hypothetical protein